MLSYQKVSLLRKSHNWFPIPPGFHRDKPVWKIVSFSLAVATAESLLVFASHSPGADPIREAQEFKRDIYCSLLPFRMFFSPSSSILIAFYWLDGRRIEIKPETKKTIYESEKREDQRIHTHWLTDGLTAKSACVTECGSAMRTTWQAKVFFLLLHSLLSRGCVFARATSNRLSSVNICALGT